KHQQPDQDGEDTGAGVPQQATIPRCHLLPPRRSSAVSGWNPSMITHHDWGRTELVNPDQGKVRKNTIKCKTKNIHGTQLSIWVIGRYSFGLFPRCTESHSASYGLIGKRFSMAWTTCHLAEFRFRYDKTILNQNIVSKHPANARSHI